MLLNFSSWQDTIAAPATASGMAAIAVIRISGTQAIEIVNKLFPSKNLLAQPSHTLHVGSLVYRNKILDEVVVALFKQPTSYTGENVVEISCHGSPYIQQQILQALAEESVRMAKPGEFTQRAFLNGKIDLVQAEAVADLIASNTEASKNAALHYLRGGFSQTLHQLREQLVQFSSLIELELDFSQEDVEFANRSQLQALIHTLQTTTRQLLDSFALGNVVKNGVQVAIVGKPNAGKSTLLNALLQENRAIVSEIPGTTRDTIEEVINIEGILFRFIDTAGIRTHTYDAIESIGMQRSYEKMKQADVVLYLFDVHEGGAKELEEIKVKLLEAGVKHFLLIGNKIDVPHYSQHAEEKVLYISAKNGTNIEFLKKELVQLIVQGNIHTESTIVTNARHYEALQQLYEALNDVQQAMHDNLPGDLIALDIRRALHYLGILTGSVSVEEQLAFIFSKFCIGK